MCAMTVPSIPAPPAAVYYASSDRRGEHRRGIWRGSPASCRPTVTIASSRCSKVLPITPAFCLAHAPWGFFELADIEKTARDGQKGKPVSPIALKAVRRVDALFEIERAINGRSADERRIVRQKRSKPLLVDMHDWLLHEREPLSRSSEVLKPINYMLRRWADFARLLDDGRICLTRRPGKAQLDLRREHARNAPGGRPPALVSPPRPAPQTHRWTTTRLHRHGPRLLAADRCKVRSTASVRSFAVGVVSGKRRGSASKQIMRQFNNTLQIPAGFSSQPVGLPTPSMLSFSSSRSICPRVEPVPRGRHSTISDRSRSFSTSVLPYSAMSG